MKNVLRCASIRGRAVVARVLLFCLAAVGAASLHATPGDSHWDRQFGLPGTTNRVQALRFNGNTLYASGSTVGAGSLVATNTGIDAFDGTNWTTAFGEVTGGSCIVFDLAFLGSNVYVGGVFSRAGGISTPGLAKWNGSDWSNIGLSGAVFSMISDGTNIYVGGSFTNPAGVLCTNVARYNGTNWFALGGGVGFYSTFSSYINVLELHNGLLYAGGFFTNASGVAATNIAVWNGTVWASLGAGPANGVNNEVGAIVFSGTDLYAGGGFTAAGGVTANGIAKWNGASWSALGAGAKGYVSSIGILGTDIYVAGTLTNIGGVTANAFGKWNGTTWTTWPTSDGVFQYPLNGDANRIIVKDGSLYIGGIFSEAFGVNANHVVRYDGTNAYALGTKPANGIATPPVNLATGCIGQANDGIYVGGLFTAAGKTAANRIARWDGTNWYSVGGGTMGGSASANRVQAIAGYNNDVYVGGNFTNVAGINVSNIAHWNGTSWSAMGNGFDSGVSTIAATASAVYVGGGFTNVIGPPFNLNVNHIAMWDGANWSSLNSGVNSNGTVNVITVSGANVYVGGTFTNAGGVAANRVAVWNGSIWASLGTGTANGVSGSVLAIAVNGSDVYVGGIYTNAGVSVVRGIAKWDGANWSGLGSGATGPSTAEVRALVFGSDGKLYCGGRYTNMSGLNANYVSRWDGVKWEALGGGIYADTALFRVTGMAARGNDVFAVGSFDGVGLADSYGIARWNESINFTPPYTMNFSRSRTLTNNLFTTRLTATEHATYGIEYSDDFQTWTALSTNASTQIDITNAMPPSVIRRVYRSRGILP